MVQTSQFFYVFYIFLKISKISEIPSFQVLTTRILCVFLQCFVWLKGTHTKFSTQSHKTLLEINTTQKYLECGRIFGYILRLGSILKWA
jgi:hypothetical protein